MVILIFSVDRDRLRERERQARAAMSVQAEQAAAGGGPDTRHHQHHHNHANHHVNIHVSKPLFHAPVRVNTFFHLNSILTNDEIIFLRHRIFLYILHAIILIFFYKYLTSRNELVQRYISILKYIFVWMYVKWNVNVSSPKTRYVESDDDSTMCAGSTL